MLMILSFTFEHLVPLSTVPVAGVSWPRVAEVGSQRDPPHREYRMALPAAGRSRGPALGSDCSRRRHPLDSWSLSHSIWTRFAFAASVVETIAGLVAATSCRRLEPRKIELCADSSALSPTPSPLWTA